MKKRSFGKTKDGQDAMLYTLVNANGMKAEITNYGGILVNLIVPDKTGKLEDVVLGYDSIDGYLDNPSFFGATIGPSANRIANAKFKIDDTEYQLDENDGSNNLHSHKELGYHKLIWDVIEGTNSVTFLIQDKDGYLGFPGNKKMEVKYTLTEDNSLVIEYKAESDKKTVLNPTNHTYFNLDGHNSGGIEEHILSICASYYTPVLEGSIPTGEIASVAETPMDFLQEKKIGRNINEKVEQLELTGGYDHNWVIDGWDGSLKEIAKLIGPKSGRVMYTYTTLPGVQFYAGNFITTQKGKAEAIYDKRMGLCLETQFFPNSINETTFPSCIFGEEKSYYSTTVYKFE